MLVPRAVEEDHRAHPQSGRLVYWAHTDLLPKSGDASRRPSARWSTSRLDDDFRDYSHGIKVTTESAQVVKDDQRRLHPEAMSPTSASASSTGPAWPGSRGAAGQARGLGQAARLHEQPRSSSLGQAARIAAQRRRRSPIKSQSEKKEPTPPKRKAKQAEIFTAPERPRQRGPGRGGHHPKGEGLAWDDGAHRRAGPEAGRIGGQGGRQARGRAREKQKHRIPAVREAAIAAAVTEKYQADALTTEEHAAFIAGFRSRAGGRNKSTLAGERIAHMHDGYAAGATG